MFGFWCLHLIYYVYGMDMTSIFVFFFDFSQLFYLMRKYEFYAAFYFENPISIFNVLYKAKPHYC